MYLLAESHLTIHTFPESGIATLNLYCCTPRSALDWHTLLAPLGAARVTVRELVRGQGSAQEISRGEGAPREALGEPVVVEHRAAAASGTRS
jgi:S-adenosylmethionine/arginine decarboxylase-like enzyme